MSDNNEGMERLDIRDYYFFSYHLLLGTCDVTPAIQAQHVFSADWYARSIMQF